MTDTEVKAPLVFQCAKCRTIVGDSYAFISSNQDINIVTLSAASNVRRSREVYTAKKGLDIGSTYFSFVCACCGTNIGRYYLTTSSDLDILRDKFSFLIDEISSYELGKSQVGTIPDFTSETTFSDEGSFKSSSGMCSGCSSLGDELLKVQQVIISLTERVADLEQRGYDHGSQEFPNAVNKRQRASGNPQRY